MELVLPNNYVEVDQEEMSYLDGGSTAIFQKNLKGLIIKLGNGKMIGSTLGAALTMGYWASMAYLPGAVAKIASLTGNPIVVGLAAMGAAGMVWALWNVRMFY